jgi:two-component sensor histidine kinase
MKSLHGRYRLTLIIAILVVAGITGAACRSYQRWQMSELAAARTSRVVKLAGELIWLSSENHPGERALTQWNRTILAIEEQLGHLSHELEGFSHNPDARPGPDLEIIGRLLSWSNEVFHLMGNARTDRARHLYNNSLATVVANLTSSVRILNIVHGVESRRAAVTELIAVLVVSSGILLSIVVMVGVFLRYRVLTPLRDLQNAIAAYGRGGEELRVDPVGTVEIDALVQSYNETVATISQLFRDKEILIRETHHRIKNNIASIGSLLSLQASTTDNREAAEVLEEAVGRVYSVRDLYDLMLLGDQYREMDAASYLEELTKSVAALSDGRAHIKIVRDLESIVLPQKQLVSLGIIANELLTNAYKYAFRNQDEGIITLRLYRDDTTMILSVEDNGAGLKLLEDKEGATGAESATRSIPGRGGFGLSLVEMICGQIQGSFSIENVDPAGCGGTRATVTFL